MMCSKCSNKMAEITLTSRKGREYKAGVCLNCGEFATRCNEKDVWIGMKIC